MKHERTTQNPAVAVDMEEQEEQDIEGILRSLRQNIKLTQEQQKSRKNEGNNVRDAASRIRVDTGRDAFAITDLEMQNCSKEKAQVPRAGAGMKESECAVDVKPDPTKRSSHVKLEHLIGLLASLQFATVVLITRVRLPTADNVESFVIFSMLFITAGTFRLKMTLLNIAPSYSVL